MKTITKLWFFIVVLIILTPLGIILPRYFRSGPAFGEEKVSSFWNAPMPDYGHGWPGYIISAILGVAVIAGLVFVAGKIAKK